MSFFRCVVCGIGFWACSFLFGEVDTCVDCARRLDDEE
jgi:hypothetical protein